MGRLDGNHRDLKLFRPNRHALPFESLVFRKYHVGNVSPHPAHPVCAIDTETYQGAAKLIADSWGNYLLDGDIDGILSFLTQRRFRRQHIFCYNLQFDAEAVLKMLPQENVQDLVNTNKTDYRKYRLKYIPKKLLTIRDPHRNTSRFFDIAQFFETSLDSALKKYLQLEKTDYPHRASLNTDPQVWESETPLIVSYCLDDARKTALLAEFMQANILKLFSFNPRSYISKASLAKDLVRISGYIPDTRKIPRGALRYAFYSYKGGRFEVCQRGYFPETELYDLNSAYPSTIRNLIDVTLGQWRKVTEMNLDCHYGFYLCSVFVLPSFLCPIAFILPVQVLCFPAGKIITYLTKEEIIAYETYADIQILHGYEFYPSEIQYPFRDYIDALHAQKQLLEKNDYQYDLVKKMMNSLYGCFYEKNVQDDKINTGKLFNPIYAAIITADTRIKLFETAVTREKNVIAMATDSLLFDRKIPLKTSTKLGGWQKESTGDAVVLQSGVYQIAGKLRTRGMQRTSKIIVSGKEFESIFDVIRADPKPTSYTIVQERPFHLRECLKRLNITTQECVNVWHESPKTFSVNRDIKRRWAQKFKHGGDIFETSHRSETWKFYSEK